MNQELIQKLQHVVGEDYVVTQEDQMTGYIYDESEIPVRFEPSRGNVVVKPATAQEISQILKMANEQLFPVVVRGAGTGVVGGVSPVKPSVIISMERFKKIVELDEANMTITAQAGVTLSDLNEYITANSKTLRFPIHPGDESAHIGGMIIANAGGVGAVKYGVMRGYVRALEVVLPTGEIVRWGGKMIKNNMGLDLVHLMIGSEGILGIVTEATLKLYPRTDFKATMLVSFPDGSMAAKAVPQVLSGGTTPEAIEFMDRETALVAAEHIGKDYPVKNDGKVDLMFIVTSDNEEDLYKQAENVVQICEENGALDTLMADTAQDQRNILEIRSNIITAYKELLADAFDTAVPISCIPDYVNDLKKLNEKYNQPSVTFGHFGDGNVHNVFLKVDGKKPDYVDAMREEMYKLCVEKYHGTVTAEHGTGLLRKPYMKIMFSDAEIALMSRIKHAFDPNGILNPGVMVD